MPKLVIEFTKMNGAGNDFVVLDNRFFHFSDEELAAFARRWCPRRTGIGADGLLALAHPEQPGAHFRMRYFNADGSTGIMCGNGARCIVSFARHAGIEAERYVFETDAGLYSAHVLDGSIVRLEVPPPSGFRPEFELTPESRRHVGNPPYVYTGTDHIVCFSPDVDRVPVLDWGRAVRHDPALQPKGTNVDFVEIRDDRTVRVRTFERGVEDETLACGTGALASAIVARLTGKIKSDEVDVEMPGGVLKVGFRLSGSEVTDVYLEGPTEIVFRGTFEI